MGEQLTRVWATRRVNRNGVLVRGFHPCIWGTKAEACEGCDADEVVQQIEYRVLKQVTPRQRHASADDEVPWW